MRQRSWNWFGCVDSSHSVDATEQHVNRFVACVVVLGWGVNFVLSKHALNQFSVGAFNFFRFGGMIALGWAVIALTGGQTAVVREDRRRLILVAIVGFCGYVFGFSVGLTYTSAFSASLLLALVPLCCSPCR